MTTLDQSPFLWIEFDKNGALVDPDVRDRLEQALAAGATDLVVMSHGWKNDRVAALRIYKPLWRNTRAALTRLDPTKIVVVGVLWPSVPYRTNFDEAALLDAAHQGALSADGGGSIEDISDAQLADAVDDFLEGGADPAFRALAQAAAQDLSSDEASALLAAALGRTAAQGADAELTADLQGLVERAEREPKDILPGLAAKPVLTVEPSAGGALGIGDDIAKFFAGSKAAVARLLGQLSFYDMKARAGTVGASLGTLLATSVPSTVRLHLVGHSFGARLVTSAASVLAGKPRPIASLTLLQGAFSHNALSPDFEGKPGAFAAAAATGAVGVTAITHTHNDRACTLAYAAASRLSREVASGIGEADDRFGAMGANGAQNIPVVAHTATPGTSEAAPVLGRINNYLADAWIQGNPPGTDAHGDVFNPVVGKLLATVVEA